MVLQAKHPRRKITNILLNEVCQHVIKKKWVRDLLVIIRVRKRKISLQYCRLNYIKAVMCLYLCIHTVMNATILQLVTIYNIQLHVSALYVRHHQVVQRTY